MTCGPNDGAAIAPEPANPTAGESTAAALLETSRPLPTVAPSRCPEPGLTPIGGRPQEDWAADTGPARDENEVEEAEPPPE